MSLTSKLARMLAIPAAFVAVACDDGSSDDAVIVQPNACVPTAAAKERYPEVCTPDDLKKGEHNPGCHFESCALPESGTCERDFEPAVRSKAPTSMVCRLGTVTEL